LARRQIARKEVARLMHVALQDKQLGAAAVTFAETTVNTIAVITTDNLISDSFPSG